MENDHLTDEDKVPRLLTDVMADALICNYTHDIPPGLLELVNRYSIPVVWINTAMEHDCIRPNDREAGRMATAHLIELGHKNIGYLAFTQSGHYSEEARLAGYEEAMKAAGLKPCVQLLKTNPPIDPTKKASDDRLAICRDFLQGPDCPTAVVTYSMTATKPLWAAAYQLGKSIPDDLSIVTIGDTLENPFGISATTVVLPTEEIGRRAVDAVLRKMEHPTRKFPPEFIHPRLHAGASTRKVSE
jgi:LacI family transcriptional regulator